MKLSLERIFYYSSLLFAFSFPLSRAAVSFFIVWFILLFLLRNDYRNAWEKIKSSPVFWAMGAFIALLTLSILWSDDKADALNQIRLYGYWIIIPILAVTLKREWLSSMMTAFLGGMLVSIVIAYGIYFELWTVNERPADYPSPFMTHIHYSIFLAFASVILLYRLLAERYSWKIKGILVLFLIAAVGNLFLSTGRTGQLAFLVAMILTLAIHYRLTLKSFFLFSLLGIGLFFGTYASITQFEKRIDSAVNDIRQLQLPETNYGSSLGIRAVFWIITYDIVHKHPFLGVGLGDYKHAAAEVLRENDHGIKRGVVAWCTDTHFHNQYLMILAQTGLIGFGLMIWFLIELFRLKIDDAELKGFSILGLCVFCIGCIAEPLWILQFPIILFIFIVSVSLAASMNTTTPKKEA